MNVHVFHFNSNIKIHPSLISEDKQSTYANGNIHDLKNSDNQN